MVFAYKKNQMSTALFYHGGGIISHQKNISRFPYNSTTTPRPANSSVEVPESRLTQGTAKSGVNVLD
jgi:hypothetical protein